MLNSSTALGHSFSVDPAATFSFAQLISGDRFKRGPRMTAYVVKRARAVDRTLWADRQLAKRSHLISQALMALPRIIVSKLNEY